MSQSLAPYLALSYHFETDRAFVGWLQDKLRDNGILVWFFDSFDDATIDDFVPESGRDTRYEEDWRRKIENWPATYLRQIQYANGIIIVRSSEAMKSLATTGRGMWREAEAISYIEARDPSRIKRLTNPTPHSAPDQDSTILLSDLLAWAHQILDRPPLERPSYSASQRQDFNLKTGMSGPLQAFETYSRATDWYQMVRLDLYDVMWFCRRCGLESDNFMFSEERPPQACPHCKFGAYDTDYDPSGLTIPPGTAPLKFKSEEESRAWHMSIAAGAVDVLRLAETALAHRKAGLHGEAWATTVALESKCRDLHNLEPLSECLWDQVVCVHQEAELTEAAFLLGHAERILREIGDKVMLHYALGNIGTTLMSFGRYNTALERLREKAQICRDLRDAAGLEKALYNEALALHRKGNTADALHVLEEQQSLCEALQLEEGLRSGEALLSEIHEHTESTDAF